MSHYVFFTALDYSQDVRHYLWLSEGIAEYFCRRHDDRQVRGTDSINFIRMNCQLDDEFPIEASYWAGESFFLFIERNMGRKTVKTFLQDAYRCTTDSVFIKMDLAPADLHQQWISSLEPQPIDSTVIMAVIGD